MISRTGKVAQQLRAMADLSEHLGAISSTNMMVVTICHSTSKGSDIL